MRKRLFLSYDQIALWIESIAPQLREGQFSAVVAILRGGLFPAQCVAFETGLPLAFMAYDRVGQKAAWTGSPPSSGKLLVCEDIAGQGRTLTDCLQLIVQTHPDHRVLAVASDELSRFEPDWSQHFEGWQVVFPWERHDSVPAHQADWAQGGALGERPMQPDHAYRLWAVDLDGVLCRDMPAEFYESDLQKCLEQRDGLALAERLPRFDPLTHVIITGRPEQDRTRTQAWLARFGLDGLQVHFRDPALDPSTAEGAALHKGRTADALGCTDFIESCPRQAALIAAGWPQLRVYWWRDGEALRVVAKAVSL